MNRGVAAYDGKIIVGTSTVGSSPSMRQRAAGVVGEDHRPEKPYSITGAPRVANGKVFIGNGGARVGLRGYVAAYDAEDRQARLALLHRARQPGQDGVRETTMRMAAATWAGEWWDSAVAARPGMPSSTIRRPIMCTSARATVRRGRAVRSPGKRQSVSRVDRCGEGRHGRVRVALPGDAGRAGTTTALSRSSLRT